MCGVGAVVGIDHDGRPSSARLSFISVTETPMVLDVSDAAREGGGALADAARAAIDPVGDLHASADFRRQLAGVLAERAVAQAAEHARERSSTAVSA